MDNQERGRNLSAHSSVTCGHRRKPHLIKRLFEFFFPHYCKVCGRRLDPSEEQLCITCYLRMPILDYSQGEFSPVERMLITESSVVRAASFLSYSKESDYRQLLFHLKYWNHPDVGRWLARIGAERLLDKGFFEGIECIVPLPLSSSKRNKRGYNQCMYIADGIHKVTGIPIVDNVVWREGENSRQAGLGLYQRWGNAQGLFIVGDKTRLQNSHVLVVDDVMTTGATLCSMIETMEKEIHGIRISVFTLALTAK